jgi:hypothetical protein
MQLGYFYVKGNNCFDLVRELITKEFKEPYIKTIPDGNIYFVEDYSFLANSDLMIVISVEKAHNSNDACEIEVIAGGGGEGVFSINMGNEERRVDKIYQHLPKILRTT